MQNAAARAEPAGRESEMARIYRDHATRIMSAAYRITGNSQDAEDVLQTVFMRLVRRNSGSGLTDEPSAYLHRAAINAGLDVVRSRRAARTTRLEDVQPVLASASSKAPERVVGGSEIREKVRAAVAQLSPRSAEIFALRFFEGYDNHEIARMLGTSRGSVAVMLHRARQRVRDAIRSDFGEHDHD